jgi:glycosyltransferase involved in cell wall biosynthesis
MYHTGEIETGDIIFTSDIWFPGLESIAYLNYFCNKDVKIRGFLHAGSFTDTDFVRDMERWAKNFEDVIFDISDKVFIASNFIKNDVIKKRLIDEKKLIVTGLPLDDKEFMQYKSNKKEDIVIFNGRNVDEKQPWLFNELSKRIPNIKFINTHSKKLPKTDYYKLLGKSKVVVSFALQENFGIGVNEAVKLGCIPVLPNRVVYPEFYNKDYLYNNFDECVQLVKSAITGELKQTESNYTFDLKEWFEC